MASGSERDPRIRFGPFTLDAENARLYRGDEIVALRAKTLAVLRHLAARPGRLVSKDELLQEVWPEVHVSEDVLVGCVRELRIALGERRGEPRFVETVYGRGYRWIGGGEAPDADRARHPIFVGREADLAHLARCFGRAAGGERTVVFVGGDAGIGKTALVDAFVRTLPDRGALVARGQCVEQYGPAEPFLPILDALERLARDPAEPRAAATLAACLPDAFRTPAAAPASAIMPERAVRLLGGALEALAAERALVVVLEDLHWSDPSTLDVLSYVARRPEPCRLMLLATYRPTDVILRRHPVRGLERELRAHRQSVQLSLGRLSPASVADWLAALCASPPPALVQWLHRRTEGHPLFVGALLEALVAAGSVDCGGGEWTLAPGYAEFGVPESVSLMIDREAESLDPTDREVLDAASAAGTPFSAASVAAAVERDVVAVEARCDALARDGRFVRAAGSSEWPDGTVASAYDFIHELHRSRLYERLSPSHARLLHQRVGRRLEQAYGARVDEIATELSVHFERGRDAPRALRHLDTVATHCAARGAHREAIATLRRALAVTDLLPGSTERVDRRLYLGLRLGASLLVAEDYADPEVERTFRTCRDLAERADALPPLLTALAGLHAYHSARARLDDAAAIVPRMLELAARLPLAEATLVAHTCAAWSAWSCGELAVAREHARQAIAVKPSVPMPFPSTFDLVGWAFGTQAFAELALGDVPGARALSEEGVAWSERTARPVDRATALALAGMLSACEGDRPSAAARAHAAVAVAEEHGYRQWRAIGRIVAAWADAADPAPHVDEYVRLGFRAELSTFLCLAAEVRLRAGATEAALALVDRAEEHVRETGERWYEAEVHRLRGEAWIADDARRAEAALQRALDVARAQGAKLWELRARRLLDGLG